MTEHSEVQARTVKDFCRAYGIGRTMTYELIGQGRLRAVKAGARTLIDEESARVWFATLTTEKASAKTHEPTHADSPNGGERKPTGADR